MRQTLNATLCRSLYFTLATLVTMATAAVGEEIWVDNLAGSDSNPGTREQPLAKVSVGLERLKPGMSLHLVKTPTPYPATIRVEIGGTSEAPIVIDGHGSIVSGRAEVPVAQWQDEGDGVLSRKLTNNAWGMQRHWEGGFPLVWFDDRPGTNATARDVLQPGGFFLYKNRAEARTDPLHDTLFIRLPEGVRPETTRIETIVAEGGVFIGGNHVVVRNLICEYGGRDGFSTHRNQNVVFENVEARFFMDQGISNHGAQAIVRDSHFHHNAGGGIVDVYPEARVRYENCLIEHDTWRGGVEFHSGTFEMVGCIIRGNRGKALAVTRSATVTLENCLLIDGDTPATTGISLGTGETLTMQQSTLYGFKTGLGAQLAASSRLDMQACAFLRCQTNLDITLRQEAGASEVVPAEIITATGNVYEPAPWHLTRLVQNPENKGWSRDTKVFTADRHDAFAVAIDGDHDAVVQAFPEADSPARLPTSMPNNAGARSTGASHWVKGEISAQQ